MSQSLSYLIQRLKPYWLDAAAAVAGIELNKIIHFPANSDPAEFYDKTEAGLLLALAATADESVVLLPACDITLTAPVTIPDDITLVGRSVADSILNGDHLVLGDECMVANLSLYNAANDANPLYGVINANYEHAATLWNCVIDVQQTGAGNAYAIAATQSITANWGDIHVKYCHVYGSSTGGDGYAGISTAGRLYVWHSRLIGSEDRFA